MLRNAETRMINETFINNITSNDAELYKEALDGATEYLRMVMREDGFWRRVLPAETITAEDLDRQVDTNKPVVIIDMEPNSPGAVSVPFATMPTQHYIGSDKYRVMFDVIQTPTFRDSIYNLMTYDMDIRQVLKDLLVKDIMAEEDGKAMTTVDSIVGTVNTVDATLACCQYITVGALDRQAMAHAHKGLSSTNRHLNASKCLVNNIFIHDIVALTRDEVGGDLAEEMFVNGFAERKLGGIDYLITIKTDLVGDTEMYMFAEPKYTGKFLLLDDITMFSKHENQMIEFGSWECAGCTIGNIAAVAKADFSGSQVDWRTGT